MLEKLKKEVYEANMKLVDYNLVIQKDVLRRSRRGSRLEAHKGKRAWCQGYR